MGQQETEPSANAAEIGRAGGLRARRRPAGVRWERDALVETVPDGGTLFRDLHIKCPMCERWFHMFSIRVMEYVEKYAKETVPVYRCPRKQCGHYFALHPNP